MNDLSWFKPWTPLRGIPFPTQKVGDSIYNIAPSAFVFTVKYNRSLVEDEYSPYATILIFAPSSGAAERSLNSAVTLDSQEPLDLALIPAIGITDWSYASLSKLPGVFESARYHGLTGQFVEVSLRWGSFEFCFRENNLGSESKPYLLRYSPKV